VVYFEWRGVAWKASVSIETWNWHSVSLPVFRCETSILVTPTLKLFMPHQPSPLSLLMTGRVFFLVVEHVCVCGVQDMDFDEPGELAFCFRLF
jgi:hypothetical protein